MNNMYKFNSCYNIYSTDLLNILETIKEDKRGDFKLVTAPSYFNPYVALIGWLKAISFPCREQCRQLLKTKDKP